MGKKFNLNKKLINKRSRFHKRWRKDEDVQLHHNEHVTTTTIITFNFVLLFSYRHLLSKARKAGTLAFDALPFTFKLPVIFF